MILGVIIGIIMGDIRGVLFASLAAIPVRLGMFFLAGGTAALWNEFAAMAIVSYATCAAVALLTYGIKRALRRRATGDASA